MKKYASVKYVDFNQYNRVIAVSDIHGDSDSFVGVLEKIGFSDSDALVIVGDILGKGSRSLELLQMVVRCAKKGNLYMVKGNHDGVLNDWCDGRISDEDIDSFISSGGSNIITEMAAELKLECKTLDDVMRIKETIKMVYGSEIRFLGELPHIIDSNIAVFVHAGIRPGLLSEQDCGYCLSAKAFADQEYQFEKPVIVGHWPASNYSEDVIIANSYFNKKNHTISIDGGNSMKSWKQLNYLILSGSGEMIESGYYDCLPKVIALEEQEESTEHITLIFPKTRVEIKKKMEDESLCYIPYLNREMMIENGHIYFYKGNMYCWDFTTYYMRISEGEVLSYCKDEKDCILVKREGVVGKYAGKYRFV